MKRSQFDGAIYRDIESALTNEWQTIAEIKGKMKYPTNLLPLRIMTLLKQNIVEVKYIGKIYDLHPLYRKKQKPKGT